MVTGTKAALIALHLYFTTLLAREFVVLSENDGMRWISDVEIGGTETAQSSSAAIGCRGGHLIVYCEENSVCNATFTLYFRVHGLLMGPNAGRSYVFVDEVQVASCNTEVCSVRIPLDQHTAADCRHKFDSYRCTFEHEISIRLFGLEATLQYEEIIFLGDTLRFLISHTSEKDSLMDFHRDRRLPVQQCTNFDQADQALNGREAVQHSLGVKNELDLQGFDEPERVAEEGESSKSQQRFMQQLIQRHPEVIEVLSTCSDEHR
jgi:hypothetical protein